MSIFEIIMLLCFGLAWPFSIYKTYIARCNESKSVIFLYAVLVGYGCGILHKLLYNCDAVIFLYSLNGVMVAIDITFYHRNSRIVKIQKRANIAVIGPDTSR